jgi:hypothetical protein
VFDAQGWFDVLRDHYERAADAVYRGYDRVPVVIPWTALPLPGEEYAQERTALLKVMIGFTIEEARRTATEIRNDTLYFADLDRQPPWAVVRTYPPHWDAAMKAAFMAGFENPTGSLSLVPPDDGSTAEPLLKSADEARAVLEDMAELGRIFRRSSGDPKAIAEVLFDQ